MPFQIVQGDITKMKVDAIVNAANNLLQRGGGVCGAIFSAADSPLLQEECNKIGHCPTGSAVITKGYKLKAKYIIHAVGPVWRGGNNNEENLLYSAYFESMKLASENNLESIAFPLISSGIYGYPKEEAFRVAKAAINDFLISNEMSVYLVLFDNNLPYLDTEVKREVLEYTTLNYVKPTKDKRLRRLKLNLPIESYGNQYTIQESPYVPQRDKNLARAGYHSMFDITGETFSKMLLRLIDERNLTDPEVYKKANMDRKLFSKIRSNEKYKPSKNTVISLAIALNLNLDETNELLRTAGFALSPSNRADLIIEYFIKNSEYNIYKINELLFSFGEALLGA